MHMLTIVMAKDFDGIEGMLAPYDENAMVETEEGECMCVGVDGVADPKCPECGGTGRVEDNYNPDGHWDWYEEVQSDGRWPGYVVPMNPSEVNENCGEGWRGIPCAIVTPARGWLEKGWGGDNGFWAKEYWEAFDEAIKEGLKPFVVDVHD